ncbi:hypothetical protein BHF72_1682 [Cloacibacterium normanense]|uniref:Uncharacterized protein n=1 Tax=Cloacibacterium normanense TaxID=237258 RepID=A0A1E5UFZ3_9FLAO|nr:hypothetical protein BHF72_1682 [Cloacibacterium normanense]
MHENIMVKNKSGISFFNGKNFYSKLQKKSRKSALLKN